MIYAKVIVDECGEVMEYISDLLEEEVEEILKEHSEWQIKCISIEM